MQTAVESGKVGSNNFQRLRVNSEVLEIGYIDGVPANRFRLFS